MNWEYYYEIIKENRRRWLAFYRYQARRCGFVGCPPLV